VFDHLLDEYLPASLEVVAEQTHQYRHLRVPVALEADDGCDSVPDDHSYIVVVVVDDDAGSC